MIRSLATFLLSCTFAFGCAGSDDPLGMNEPFRVRNAQFVPGPLPGKAPSSGARSTPANADAGVAAKPAVTALMSLNNVVYQGQGNKKLTGEATTVSRSVGLQMRGVGSGYWVLPMAGVNPQTDNLTFSAALDFAPDLTPGKHELRVVAIDDRGFASQQAALTLCVDGKVPDNLHVCDPKRPLPQAVVSLQWDANVDLDLQVHTPDGIWLDPKHRSSEAPDDMGVLPDDAGVIDRDSNGACVIDGIRAEDLVWPKVMPHGRYGIYVNLFDPCQKPAVRFRVAVYSLVTDKNGDDVLKEFWAQGGELLDLSANGGTGRGLFVSEFVFK